MQSKKCIGIMIKKLAENNNMSTKELAERLGCTTGNVCKLYHAKDMKFSTISKLCDAINVDMKLVFTKGD